MAASTHRRFLLLLLPLVLFLLPFPLNSSSAPTPAPWPPQFHASLFVNYSGELSTIELWYDWPNGRNLNLIRSQLAPDGDVLHDVEWNNGTSFIYTLGASGSCRTLLVGVGILRPNWLEGANYLGTEKVDSFLCHVWEKEQFIWYYEDVVSRRPVHWLFYTGRSIHVMNYELGAVLEDAKWQAPAYCFNRNDNVDNVEELSELRTISNASLVEFSSLKKPENLLAA